MTLYAVAPALPLHKAGPFVAAAYIVFLAIILIYVGIMARRLIANQRDLAALRSELAERERAGQTVASPTDPTRAADSAGPAGSAGSGDPAGSEREVSRQL